jgi:hypothetical protein
MNGSPALRRELIELIGRLEDVAHAVVPAAAAYWRSWRCPMTISHNGLLSSWASCRTICCACGGSSRTAWPSICARWWGRHRSHVGAVCGGGLVCNGGCGGTQHPLFAVVRDTADRTVRSPVRRHDWILCTFMAPGLPHERTAPPSPAPNRRQPEIDIRPLTALSTVQDCELCSRGAEAQVSGQWYLISQVQGRS